MIVEPDQVAESKQVEKGLMKAIVRTRYGSPDVLEFKELEKPVPNNVRGVLVKVYASSVNPTDRYDLKPPFFFRLIGPLFRLGIGLRRPKDPGLGSDVAGRVEAVADNITQFKPGDEVFGVAPGSYAGYAVGREARLALKPANSSFEESASVPIAGLTALQALRDHGHIQPGQKVLVNGAGGGVGTFAVQIAKAFGAEVTAVTNTGNLDMLRKLGADHVIDYTEQDFAKNRESYDLICDIAASHSISDYKRIMNPNGIFVLVGMKDKIIRRLVYFLILGRLRSRGDKKFRFFIAKINQKDLVFMKELLETRKVVPAIDRRYPLNETADAIQYLIDGHARGKIVINVDQDDRRPAWSGPYVSSTGDGSR
ncbi:MAG TPA: NAD(P)-dependent alcohol dehydrogenase [Candidatus Bathyarchaeia archaeon]|nr:NAD(P)-dependent alcohol dehydrogenase [Candidatus Bathyarchaeia archaeon]